MARKKDNIIKVDQNTVPVSLTVSNPNEFPLVYGDDTWDLVPSGSSLADVMGNFGQYDQHSINEALAGNIGNAELGTAITATQTVGGITSGTNLAASTTFHDFVDMLLNPFINPSVTLTISPSGTLETGSEVTSLTMTATATKGTANISIVEFFREGYPNPLHYTSTGVAEGGTFTYTYEPDTPITSNATFRASVTDSATTQHVIDSDIKSISFANFVYYGTSASTTVPAASGLSSKVSSSSETPTFSTNAYVWYITPTSKTTIQQNIMGQWVNIDTTSIGLLASFTNAYGVEFTDTYYAYRSTNMYESGSNMTFKIV